MMPSIPGVTNSGSMPISANGGKSGDAMSKGGQNSVKFGSLNMGGNANNMMPIVGLIVVAGLAFLVMKKGK
ncbi:LPXTG cell wall anchor domain-containing protein [Vibrio sp. Of7-15]|uniref:LPXTG cell wall anchor domain-containing protein n=1 Tax=Vibrio sp. Of7-15 TaxID=2724879 RepID=UPI001EF376EF|nr:LPXTG cell wall anchor domain-containing protein [Vibrio sp. Of7-15]MCG7500041.1 LPXTG cell wall anchor domain-containing protein [Vibrio sp. Of7-15]